jgi:hypothetical protein
MDRDDNLLQFATDRQKEILEAYWSEGTYTKAAAKLNVDKSYIGKIIGAVQKKAAQRGYAPERDLTHTLPNGLILKGTSLRYNEDGQVTQYWNKSRLEGRDPEEVTKLPDPKKIVKLSTLYDQAGNVSQQWVSEKPEDIQREKLWQIFADELKKELPRLAPSLPPAHENSDLLVGYPIGDHHYGMYAWRQEAGGDYDLDIADRLLKGAIDHLVYAAPKADTAVAFFLGDFMHYDSMIPVTPTGKNQLDADSRFPKMVRAAIRGMRYTIDALLAKHRNVIAIIEIGNHDLASSIFLMECLSCLYENEPRVKIDTSPQHFHYVEFGKVLIGTHHGHGTKLESLPLIMAADRPEAWGRTVHRMWLTGHIHQKRAFEIGGVDVESFRILGPTDAWAQQKGYRSKRGMTSIVFHKEDGEVGRHTVSPAMLMR